MQGMLEQIIGMKRPEGELRTRLDTQVAYSNPLEAELMKQKSR